MASPGRRGHPRMFYEQVAEVYNEAIEAGSRAPTRDVAETWQAREVTARTWVMRAKNLGIGLLEKPPACRHRCNRHCPSSVG